MVKINYFKFIYLLYPHQSNPTTKSCKHCTRHHTNICKVLWGCWPPFPNRGHEWHCFTLNGSFNFKKWENLPIVFRSNSMVINLSSNKNMDIGTLHTPFSNAHDIRGGFLIKILFSQWRDAMCALEAHNFFLLEKGEGGCEIFLFILSKGDLRVFLVLFWVMGGFFVSWHTLVCKVVVKVQKQFYFFHLHGWLTWRQHFLKISLQGSCGSPKRVLLLSVARVGHMVKR